MIFIDRDREDRTGKQISPDQAWLAKAKTATEAAIANQGIQEFDGGIYAADIVRAALEELFHRKCAYCEYKLAGTFDVEHYRPKGRVAEDMNHPGYYWLAYTWSNLLPSCEFCNQRRRDKPIWGDLKYANTGGKSDQFPLVDEDERAKAPCEPLEAEHPLLIDPCAINPEHHIKYLANGEVFATDQEGEATISICNLNRRRLKELRVKKMNCLIDAIALMPASVNRKKTGNENRIRRFIDKHFLDDSNSFAGISRYILNYPEAFGI